jgi:predicted  nucleic acid-binding Zn-ribbon protein
LEVNRVLSRPDNGNMDRSDFKFLANLKEDLSVLETSWKNKSLHPKRVVQHFMEIIDSIAEVARVESLEPAGAICADLKEYLSSAANGKAGIGERSWNTAAELIDLLCDSVGEDGEASVGLEELRTSWIERADSDETSAAKESTKNAWATSAAEAEVPDAKPLNLEESKMPASNGTDPQELLKMAQEALLSGEGESAKEMALKAAELIAQGAAEERKKKELVLKTDLENITNEESEIELSITHTNERISEQETKLNGLTERLSEAQSMLDRREAECKEVRDGIDKAEAEMAAIKERHKALLDKFQEALPARDAAERECARIKTEYGEAPADIESLRDDMQNLEHRAEDIRGKKAEAEAELGKLAQTSAV